MSQGGEFMQLPASDLLELQTKTRHIKIKNFLYSRHLLSSPHRHYYYGLELVLEGCCVQHINGTAYACTPGAVCLMSPYDYHQFQFTHGDVATCCLSFTADVLTGELQALLEKGGSPCFLQLTPEASDRLWQQLQLLETELEEEKPLYRSAVLGIMSTILVQLLRANTPQAPRLRQGSSDIREAVSYARQHFREGLTLEEMAGRFGVTQNHFCKYFKRITGVTFKAYLLQLRLEYALGRLLQSRDSVTEICLEAGFNSPAYFAKAFRARYGASPSQLRQQR